MSYLQIDAMIVDGGWLSTPKVPKIKILGLCHISEEKLEMKLIFLHADKHQNSPQVDFDTLCIKVSCKVILALLMGMMKHSENTQSNKFTISLQYLKKRS